MAEKYHLYMDEAGSFEGFKEEVHSSNRNNPSLIFGLLIPDSEKEKFKQDFQMLCLSFNYNNALIHAADLKTDKKFNEFVTKTVNLLTTNPAVLPFAIGHDGDVYEKMPPALCESFAANRYLAMVQTMIEHLLFLHPLFFGRDISVDFQPNSRAYGLSTDQPEKIETFKQMGYRINSKVKDKGVVVFYILTKEILRSYLHCAAIDYAPWGGKIGKRDWGTVKTIVARNSDDPFVAMVDILAYILRSQNPIYHSSSTHIKELLTVDLAYGSKQQQYRSLVQLYLNGNLVEFIPAAIEALPKFKRNYYRTQLEALLAKCAEQADIADIKALAAIEEKVSRYLRESQGNWGFVQTLIDTLLKTLDTLPPGAATASQTDPVRFRLYNDKLSLHNHRGEHLQAWQAYKKIQALDVKPSDVESWRERMALENRMGVAYANIFAFEESNSRLAPMVETLDKARAILAEQAGIPLQDPLMGKILGTSAQNYAFLAPRDPGHFETAETLFLQALEQFSRADDRLRHQVNLVDLYLDWGKKEQALQRISEIYSAPAFKRFSEAPGPETTKHMQFTLRAVLKFFLWAGEKEEHEKLLAFYPLENLSAWFGSAFNEHPFELVCAYLGRMALAVGEMARAEGYFKHALNVPPTQDFTEQPTLQAIRAQILIWRALGHPSEKEAEARDWVGEAQNMLRKIGNDPLLKTMLDLSCAEEPGGWFAPGWKALAGVDWSREFSRDACEAFLKCFTFNYH